MHVPFVLSKHSCLCLTTPLFLGAPAWVLQSLLNTSGGQCREPRCLQQEWWDQRRRVQSMTIMLGGSKKFCPAVIKHKLSDACPCMPRTHAGAWAGERDLLIQTLVHNVRVTACGGEGQASTFQQVSSKRRTYSLRG